MSWFVSMTLPDHDLGRCPLVRSWHCSCQRSQCPCGSQTRPSRVGTSASEHVINAKLKHTKFLLMVVLTPSRILSEWLRTPILQKCLVRLLRLSALGNLRLPLKDFTGPRRLCRVPATSDSVATVSPWPVAKLRVMGRKLNSICFRQPVNQMKMTSVDCDLSACWC